MKNKKHIYMLLIFLVFMLTISAVSAAEDTATNVNSIDNDDEIILEETPTENNLNEANEEIILEETPKEEILTVENENNDGNLKAAQYSTKIIYKDMNTKTVNVDVDGRIGEYFEVTLQDGSGNPLPGKPIQIGFNGKVYNRTTNATGGARLQINLARADIYTFAIAFLGDLDYNGSFAVAKITTTAQTPQLTVPNKTYKATASTKSITATFKAPSGKVVPNKKITFTVNGKNYSGTTNSKGVVTVKVSLSKKGTYTITAKFASDGTYAAIKKTAKLTLN